MVRRLARLKVAGAFPPGGRQVSFCMKAQVDDFLEVVRI